MQYIVSVRTMPTPLFPGSPFAPSLAMYAIEYAVTLFPFVSVKVVRVHRYLPFTRAGTLEDHVPEGTVLPSSLKIYLTLELWMPTPLRASSCAAVKSA